MSKSKGYNSNEKNMYMHFLFIGIEDFFFLKYIMNNNIKISNHIHIYLLKQYNQGVIIKPPWHCQ